MKYMKTIVESSAKCLKNYSLKLTLGLMAAEVFAKLSQESSVVSVERRNFNILIAIVGNFTTILSLFHA